MADLNPQTPIVVNAASGSVERVTDNLQQPQRIPPTPDVASIGTVPPASVTGLQQIAVPGASPVILESVPAGTIRPQTNDAFAATASEMARRVHQGGDSAAAAAARIAAEKGDPR